MSDAKHAIVQLQFNYNFYEFSGHATADVHHTPREGDRVTSGVPKLPGQAPLQKVLATHLLAVY
jgi:hypothetical protein